MFSSGIPSTFCISSKLLSKFWECLKISLGFIISK